ncbi:phage holin family protein [Conexibacter sp. SYSU D00693]|uniref:phage holin family protein n=1 Tax=Conexibacter sp. SYSU D00693 TaxID=2812560 RepID=UPI00196A5C2D|nr:phage holin family protein [Conexibacter sp. SYSU D00693]
MTDTTRTPERSNGSAADRPTADLVKDLSTQLSTLVRKELELAKLELTAKGKQAGIGAGMLGAGGLLALFGAGALVAAAIAGLATAVDTWLAAVIVGAVLLATAGVLALLGKNRATSALPPAPEQTIADVQEDVRFTKQRVQEARR